MWMKGCALRLEKNEKVELRRRFIINFVYFLIFAGIVALVIRYMAKWMMPFVLAFVVAVLLQRPVKWLVKLTKGGKTFFSVALVIFMVLLLAGLVLLIGWRVVVWVTAFVGDSANILAIQDMLISIGDTIGHAIAKLSSALPADAVESLMNAVDSLTDTLISAFSGLFTGVASWALALTQQLPMWIVNFIIWVVASVFCTIDYDSIMAFFFRQLPEKTCTLITVAKEHCVKTVFKVLRAYMLLMLITFAELSIGFLILGVEHALLLGALVAVVDILPVLGTGTVLIPWSLIALILGDYKMFIGIGLLYIIITVVRNVLEPRIVSGQIGLNPLVTLFFMYLGLHSIGVIGMFIFPVVVMVAKELQDAGYIHIWK